MLKLNKTALTAIALAGVLAGCGATSDVNTKADNQAPAGTGSATASAKASAKAAATKPAGPAKVGDAITIKGQADGSKLQVTALKVVDPAKSTNEFIKPESGSRYVAVQFALKNTGEAVYDDAPMNGAKVVDQEGQQFATALVDKTSAGPELPSLVKLPAGGNAKGYMVFELPKASKVAKIQFSMDSGFGDTAEWVRK